MGSSGKPSTIVLKTKRYKEHYKKGRKGPKQEKERDCIHFEVKRKDAQGGDDVFMACCLTPLFMLQMLQSLIFTTILEVKV